jgi:hypothetical protein
MFQSYDPDSEITEEMPAYMMEAYMALEGHMQRDDFEQSLCGVPRDTIRCTVELEVE